MQRRTLQFTEFQCFCLTCDMMSYCIIDMMSRLFFCLFLVLFVSASEIGEQKELAVTIYNDNFAMVKDVRSISFDQGQSVLYFTDVSSNIQTETVTFKAIDDPESVRVYEQNFEKNLVNTQGILKRYIEKDITVYAKMGSQSKIIRGTLLGYNSGYIMKTKFGINIINNIDGVEFPSLPQDFFTLPTLNWQVFSTKAQTTNCQVAYRTTGFKWKADYSVSLNQDETKADIGGWVTIDNNSGKKYVDAKLKLIAGDVNLVSNSNNYAAYGNGVVFARAAPAAPSFSEKSFADYHLYTLSRPVTLNESSQKQVEFIPKVYDIDIEKYHQIRISAGGYNQNNLEALNYIKFLNSENNGLGIPFPKGVVRVFKTDEDDGSLEFIGEDNIDHTPKDQNITINTGKAFDITSDKISESRRSFTGGYEAKLNMTVTNHKETDARVIVIFSNGYGDNLDMRWDNGEALDKRSATEYRWEKVLKPDEKWTVKWGEYSSS